MKIQISIRNKYLQDISSTISELRLREKNRIQGFGLSQVGSTQFFFMVTLEEIFVKVSQKYLDNRDKEPDRKLRLSFSPGEVYVLEEVFRTCDAFLPVYEYTVMSTELIQPLRSRVEVFKNVHFSKFAS